MAPRQVACAGDVSRTFILPFPSVRYLTEFPIMIRLSVPFLPPTKQYRSLQDIVKKTPNYAYQLYFANPELTKEIESNVRRIARSGQHYTC